jgi:hypothetical protein
LVQPLEPRSGAIAQPFDGSSAFTIAHQAFTRLSPPFRRQASSSVEASPHAAGQRHCWRAHPSEDQAKPQVALNVNRPLTKT